MFRKLKETLFGKKFDFSRNKGGSLQFNEAQELFCQWNAERLGISPELSRNRFISSWNALRKGHGSSLFRSFCDLSYEIFGVFFDDSKKEIYEAYSFHSHLHFLRMLSYQEPEMEKNHPFVQALSDYPEVTILDYGCGLAQKSFSLAKALKASGKKADLVLADIPTIRKSFLLWMGEKKDIPVTFLDCTREKPIPDLPPCHFCIAIEVLEHLHDPLSCFSAINNALCPGGFLLTNISDHQAEFMHVSPKLQLLRDELERLGYEEIEKETLYRKKS